MAPFFVGERSRTFAGILVNTALANITTSYLWFALTFWVYLETRNVIATGVFKNDAAKMKVTLPCRGRYECGCRRDVDQAGAVATRPAAVGELIIGPIERQSGGKQASRRADHFLGSLALHPQRDEHSGNLGGLELAKLLWAEENRKAAQPPYYLYTQLPGQEAPRFQLTSAVTPAGLWHDHGNDGSDVLVKLRRGHWVVQALIDLHGMTTAQAHNALADFLLDYLKKKNTDRYADLIKRLNIRK